MDKYYKIERALCDAVDQKRDFYQSAVVLSSVLAPISNNKEAEQVMNNILEFLRTYTPGATKDE